LEGSSETVEVSRGKINWPVCSLLEVASLPLLLKGWIANSYMSLRLWTLTLISGVECMMSIVFLVSKIISSANRKIHDEV
jgi:hypothetical protein